MKLKLTVIAMLVLGLQTLGSAAALATGSYGGETKTETASLSIKKEVRRIDGGHFDWKVDGVKKGEKLEFRIVVKNTGETKLTKINVKDEMPKELKTDDKLEFVIDELGAGESKSFLIAVTVSDQEFENGKAGKSVINKATAKTDKLEVSDTAVVSYGAAVLGKAVKLPETGPTEAIVLTVISTLMLAVGKALKKS